MVVVTLRSRGRLLDCTQRASRNQLIRKTNVSNFFLISHFNHYLLFSRRTKDLPLGNCFVPFKKFWFGKIKKKNPHPTDNIKE